MALLLPITKREFPKSVIGDFSFEDLKSTRRSRQLLNRNVRQFLVRHQALLSCDSSSSNPPPLPIDVAVFPNDEFVNSSTQLKILDAAERPLLESASPKALVIRTMNPDFLNTSRRSVRKLQDTVYHNDSAELILDLVSIRKKLNFKTNRISDDMRSGKRIKHVHTRCICAVTIWDNRSEMSDRAPLVKKQTDANLVTRQRDTGDYDLCIQLDEPFKIRAKELKIPLDAKHPDLSRSGIINDSYFTELKLIPVKPDEEWPPIPVLGKSDGDTQRGITILGSEKLRGSLVARYQKLPRVPASDVPLSTFYIFEERVHKTKYGMELNATWAISKMAEHAPEVAAKLPGSSWTVDDSGSPFGRDRVVLATRTKKTSPPAPEPMPSPSPPRKKITVSYVVDPNSMKAQDIAKELRTAELHEYGCPFCSSHTASDSQELRLHFVLMHAKYNFLLVSDHKDRHFHKLHFHIVPVQAGKPRLRASDDSIFEYHANKSPFNLEAFLNGDRSWIQEGGKQKIRTQQMVQVQRGVVEDLISTLRRQHGGHLQLKDVPEFRKPERKRHPVILLNRLHDDKRTPYSSISHRPRSISEDPMSETDDELDDEWFIQRHLEKLNIVSQDNLWSETKAEIYRRWNQHRLEENLNHSRFLSDSLVRFVRKHKQLIQSRDTGMQAAVTNILDDLERSRYITKQFCLEIRAFIYEDKDAKTQEDSPMVDATPAEAKVPTILNPRVLEQQASTSAKAHATAMAVWTKHVCGLGNSQCGICTKVIVQPYKEAMHCANADCPVAGARFHIKCLKMRKRDMGWICHGCRLIVRMEKGKGKAVAGG